MPLRVGSSKGPGVIVLVQANNIAANLFLANNLIDLIASMNVTLAFLHNRTISEHSANCVSALTRNMDTSDCALSDRQRLQLPRGV